MDACNRYMIAVSVSVILAVVILMIVLSAKVQAKVNAKGGCPECGTPVPRVRRPTSFRQALWGGWTCQNCSTEMDRHGNQLTRINA